MAAYKISIDLGNLVLKGVSKDKTGKKKRFKISNRVTTSNDATRQKRKLQVNGRTLYVGDGALQNNIIKCERNHVMDQILVMIGALTDKKDSVVDVDLALGLPPKQEFNESYKKTLIDKVTVGTPIECRIGGDYKQINIKSLHIYHEGYSAYCHVYDENFANTTLVVDIGGGTIDACSYALNIDTDEIEPVRVHTIETGAIAFIEELRGYINEDLNGSVPFETIDDAIRSDGLFRYKGENHDVRKYMHLIKPTIESVVNNLDTKYGDLNNYQIIPVGGGAKLFTELAKDKISDLYEVDSEEGFYANAEGYLEQLEEDLEEIGA